MNEDHLLRALQNGGQRAQLQPLTDSALRWWVAPGWRVHGDLSLGPTDLPPDVLHLIYAASPEDALLTAELQAQPDDLAPAPGVALLAALPDDIHTLMCHVTQGPAPPAHLLLRAAELDALRGVAATLALEQALSGPPDPLAWMNALYSVSHLTFLVDPRDGRPCALTTPVGDALVIFTSPDAAAPWLQRDAPWTLASSDPARLFQLARLEGLPALAPNPRPDAIPSILIPVELGDLIAAHATPPQGEEVLPSRSVAENHLYMDIHGMEPGRRGQRLEQRGGDLVTVYEGMCHGRHRRFVFEVLDNALAVQGLGGPEPSTTIDAGQLLRHSDHLRRAIDDAASNAQAAALLSEAAECVEEALKFIPADADTLPPSAFWTTAGRWFAARFPERLHRDALVALAADDRSRARNLR